MNDKIKKSHFEQPSSIEEWKKRKAYIVSNMLEFQRQLSLADSKYRDDYEDWVKKLKSGIYKMQRELAWLKYIKIKLTNPHESTNATSKTKHDERLAIIGKAFNMLCTDIIEDDVPKFNSVKSLVNHYMILATLKNGNESDADREDED